MNETLLNRRAFTRLLGGGVALASTGLAARADTDLLAKLRAGGKIKVAIPDNRPYSGLNPDGTVTGLAPTVVKLVLERIGIPQVEGITAKYGQLIPGLQAGRWDMICACMTITAERCANTAFADPLVHEGGVLIYIPANLPDPPKTLADVAARGLRIGTGQGSVTNAKAKAAGIAEDKIMSTPDIGANLLSLETGRVDVSYNTYYGVLAELKLREDKYKLVYPLPDDVPNGAAPAFRQNDKTLYDAYQAEFRKMKASGEFAEIATRFGFPPDQALLDATAASECAKAA